MVDIAHYVANARRLQEFCNKALEDGTTFACLKALMGDSFDPTLSRVGVHILEVLDESGQVKESHPALRHLRKEVEAARMNVHDIAANSSTTIRK